MVRFISAMHSLVRDDHGATAIEYGLIATLIAVVLITALTAVGLKLGIVTSQTSATVPAGNVVSQNPVAGTTLATGSAVNLVVSTGALRGDLNHDGQVDFLDLYLLFEAYGSKVGAGDPRDLNGDGYVNYKDVKILVSLCTNSYCSIRPIHHH